MAKEFKTQLDNFKNYESEGVRTQRLLDNLKVQSPDTKNKIQIVPGFYVVPNKKLTTPKEIKTSINEQIRKFKLDRFS